MNNTLIFYVNDDKNKYHCIIHCDAQSFSTDIACMDDRRKIIYYGFSCYQLANIEELKELVRSLRIKGFKELDYFTDLEMEGLNNEREYALRRDFK